MEDKPSVDELLSKIEEMETKVRQLEAERNSVIDNIPFIAWIKDYDGRFLYVNQPYINAFQIECSQIVGKTVFDIFSYEQAQMQHQEDRKVIEQKRTIYFQTKRDNEWFSAVKSPVFSINGEIIGTTGFERNINDNIETLNSLRKERDLLQALMDNSPDIIYFKDIKSRFLRVNRAKAAELGLQNPHDAIGKSDSEFYESDKAQVQNKDEELILNTGLPLISKEEHVRRQDGSEVWISTTKSPIKDDKGNVAGLVGISRDISTQKKAMQLLQEERDFLQVLMDYIPYTIYFKDLDGRFTKVNKAQANALGIKTPEEAIGKTDFDFFSNDSAASAHEDEMQILSTGVPMIGKVEELQDADNNHWWVAATKIPVKDNRGNITGLVGISIDITEKQIAEEKLREAKEKAEESDRLKTAFLANMSHEIRTPMNGIIGFSNLLRNPGISEDEKNEFLNHITSCGNTLLTLIDDIIDISKIEAGQIKIRVAECNVNAILDELRESFEASKAKESKQQIQLVAKKQLPNNQAFILTDPFRFRQVVSNLIGNALKFTLEGFIEFGYTIQSDESLLFYVKDTGIGIPKDKQQIIFERFGQVLDSNFFINQKGTGLGLAISSNLVKLLGGRIWVESEPGMGSSFNFTLPYHQIQVDSDNEVVNEVPSSNTLFVGKTVLIADDEEVNYLFFKHLLKTSEIKLLWAKNGKEAIEIIHSNPEISMVLMDCKMPILDGYSSTRAIKELRPNLPVIAQTAFAMTDEIEKSREAGCNAYLSKPIKVKQLFDVLNKYLR